MAIKVGINGFGRIGRVVFRVLMQRQDEFELCGINLRNAELDYMAYQTLSSVALKAISKSARTA